MLTLYGVQRKSGVYQGQPYDNIMLHCLDNAPFTSPSSQLLGGSVCEMLKVKSSEVRNIFGGLVATDSDLVELIGSDLDVSYDRFGHPSRIQILDTKS